MKKRLVVTFLVLAMLLASLPAQSISAIAATVNTVQSSARADDAKAYFLGQGVKNYSSARQIAAEQKGDQTSLSKNVTKINMIASNRQPTGIYASAGETINVYVYADASTTKLPKIAFTQHIGSWRNWQTEVQLKKGLNTLTFPDFSLSAENKDEWQTPTPMAGPVYIVNPYTAAEQGNAPYIYIQGGKTFPSYKYGTTNENTFKSNLKTYYNNYKNNKNTVPDLVELYSENMILTLSASYAYKVYVADGASPYTTMSNWQTYMRKMYEFAGMTSNEYKYYRLNIRLAQPWGAAYAAYDHVGVQYHTDDWELLCLTAKNLEQSWGIAHELGHTIDFKGDTYYGEICNNMFSSFMVTSYGTTAPVRHDIVYKTVASNAIVSQYPNLYYALEDNQAAIIPYEGDGGAHFFTNLSMWWNLELYKKGFYTKFSQIHRSSAYSSIKDEALRVAACASKAIGKNLTNYFKRWGYISNDIIKACPAYTTAVSAFPSCNLKIWYLNEASYGDNASSQYTASWKPTIKSVVSANCGNTITINPVPDAQKSAHLGFEILREGIVIGFTDTLTFVDTNLKPNVSYKYSVRAYSKSLASSGYISESLASSSRVLSDGTYYIATGLRSDNSMVLDVNYASLENDANIQLYTRNTGNCQKFDVTYLSNGYYKITAVHSGKALTAKNNSAGNGTNVQQNTYTGSSGQQWIIKDAGNGYFRLATKTNANAYMETVNALSDDCTNVQLWNSHNSTNETWRFIPAEVSPTFTSGSFSIKSGNTNYAIDVINASYADKAGVQLYSYADVNQQIFTLKHVRNNYYAIYANHSDKVLEADNYGTYSGSAVYQNTFDGSDGQLWRIEKDSAGYTYFKTKSGLYLQVNSTAASGVRLSIGNRNPSVQRWKLTNQAPKNMVADGTYIITNSNLARSSKGLEIAKSSLADNANVQLGTNLRTSNQKFKITNVGGGYYSIINVISGKALTYASDNNGANVYQKTYSSTNNYQKWSIKKVGTYGFAISPFLNLSLSIETEGGGCSDGTNIQLWGNHFGDNQLWSFTKVG